MSSRVRRAFNEMSAVIEAGLWRLAKSVRASKQPGSERPRFVSGRKQSFVKQESIA